MDIKYCDVCGKRIPEWRLKRNENHYRKVKTCSVQCSNLRGRIQTKIRYYKKIEKSCY